MTARTNDFAEFDQLLLDSIRASAPLALTYTALCAMHRVAADALAPHTPGREPEGYRVVDRRLQALRKRELITPSPKGWRLA